MHDPSSNSDWYRITNVDAVDSPALLLYIDRVKENIRLALEMVGNPERFRPHVKTHKSLEVTKLMIEKGVRKFKCATIAEAEMLGMAGAKDILLAYQPVGPMAPRLIELIQKYPDSRFSCLIDHIGVARQLGKLALSASLEISVYLDLDVGMHRTGIEPGEKAIQLYRELGQVKGILPSGLHAYDGHIRNPDLAERTLVCDQVFAPVLQMRDTLVEMGMASPVLIAGGSPTFLIHAGKTDRECSPGTFVFWDLGYQTGLKEQPFRPAALVLARVISMPSPDIICLGLGHKSVAAENVLSHRVQFLNAPNLEMIGQSEEHLVARIKDGRSFEIGEVLYGIPFHVCPTVALYGSAVVIARNRVEGEWQIEARNRKIHI